MWLLIKTDQDEAELYLFNGQQEAGRAHWAAGRQLNAQLLARIEELLASVQLQWHGIKGVGVYEGPGSFTGLRIGCAVANALADGLGVPVVTVGGAAWILKAVERLTNGQSDGVAVPLYGEDAHVTLPETSKPAV